MKRVDPEYIFGDFTRLLDYQSPVMMLSLGPSTELDALGDELLMDDDSSYLDEASTAPSIPEGLPGATSTNKVLQLPSALHQTSH